MTAAEKEVFEKVLETIGINIEKEVDGLYTISHSSTIAWSEIQTHGYNLLYSLTKLAETKVGKDILR